MSAMSSIKTAAIAVFKALDVDLNETLDLGEFMKFSKQLFDDNDSEASILRSSREIINLADKDGDERLSLREWCELMESWDYKNKEAFLADCRAKALKRNSTSDNPNEVLLAFEREAITKEIFDLIDVNGTGTVDFSELTILVNLLGSESLNSTQAMMKELDADNNGLITADEWHQNTIKNISHSTFFEQMQDYKRKIRNIKLEYLQQQAHKVKAIDASLALEGQIAHFLKAHTCNFQFSIQSKQKKAALVTFSNPTIENPVPKVSVDVLFEFGKDGDCHFTFEGESFKHSVGGPNAWNDEWIASKLKFKASMQSAIGDISTTFMHQRNVGK